MQILSGIHHSCYLLIKKTPSSHSDASKITQLFHKTLLVQQQQICMMPDLNVYLKSLQNGNIQYCLPARIFGAHPPPNIIALEQNDNQAAHKLYLRNIENLPYWPGIPFGKWPMGKQSHVYYCTLQSCKSNYRNVSL